MSTITLRKALGVLAKSSPFSVKTTSERPRDVYDDLKEYLYVKPEIELDFEHVLSALRSGDCVFLCGSSGDGKSEILSRSYERYKQHYRFHLDATHSFSPHQSAIEALDELFDKREADRQPLVVGINIGMLANYAKEGAERHGELRAVIERFLSEGLRAEGEYRFLDFEAYPKFRFNDEEGGYSAFMRQLLRRLTEPSEGNLFYSIAQSDEQRQHDPKLLANFQLLGREVVQEAIITTLFKTRLFKDQFITTRALLDLLHQLLTGEGYLFDNLFMGGSNELAQKIAEFDPALLHTHAIDQFVLRYELALPDPTLDGFLQSLAEIGLYFSEPREGKAASLLRLFYLFKHCSFGNDYHHQFKGDFDEQLLESYARVWMQHGQYGGDSDAQNGLRQFYTKVLIPAIFTYANRHAPELGKREIFLGAFGGIKVAAPLELKADYKRIQYKHAEKHDHFCAYLKVGESELSPMVIGLNLFELIGKLNSGYRPNRYDKNAIILLDEMVEQIRTLAKTSPRLSYYEGGHSYRLEFDDEVITVEEMPNHV
ncbi:DNA phosphorothioation-dependent restriction protein DptF [Aeromonas enteropelogenes]|uniref:DNA phosphorothioation-dependent restriction protein DptF n=1 Tax=Aeromonas enteropelogenes TaxID=29489 RepID=UPI00191F9FE5|nr:DNA phosphorothioation-dependent restriction protein DptF [Aeromonas enteropelogenes]MBL0521087.1 DNA phosphorothioation-dependent restriction protein DptF [Aeromonas enteropelogenes]